MPLIVSSARSNPSGGASVIATDPMAHYASTAGGQLAFNITTGIVSLAANATEQLLAALINPSGSGRKLVLDLGEFGCSLNATFRRYRGGTLSNLTSPISGSNMGGGTATTVAQMYVGGTTPTFARSGGTVAKTAHIAAFQQYLTNPRGRAILLPGQSLSWTITGPTGNANGFTASVYFELADLPV